MCIRDRQTPETMQGINIVVNLVPAILYFLATLALLLWTMSDKEADEIREKLAGRRRQAEERTEVE